MKAKTKIILNYPYIAWKIHRMNKLAKKIKKAPETDTRYPEQWKNDYIARVLSKVNKTANIELEVIGWDNLPKAPALIAANHTSMWDPALIILALRDERPGSDYKNLQSAFLAKDDIAKNKRVKGIAGMMSTTFIDRKNPREALKKIDEFSDFIKKEKKFAVIFPEGSRSKDGTIKEFKSGAFRMAKKSFMPIIPVTINNSYSASNLDRTEKLKIQVIFGKQIKPMSFISLDTKSLAAKVQKIIESKWVKPVGKRSVKGANLGNS